MKDNNEERYEEEKEVDRKEEGNEEEGYVDSDAMIGTVFAVLVLMVFVAVFFGSVIVHQSSKETETVQEEEDRHDSYQDGARGMYNLLGDKEDLIKFYKSDDITEEQMKEYVDSALNIINLALSDSEIPPEAIERYNNSIKEIPFVDYDDYQLKSTGENFRRGLKGWMIANSCWQIVNYYQRQIPDEKYDTFMIIVRDNLYSMYDDNCENHQTKVLEYGKKLIEDYIGDPAEVLVSEEWRVFTGMPEK